MTAFLEAFSRVLTASGEMPPIAAQALWRTTPKARVTLAGCPQLPADMIEQARSDRAGTVRAARFAVESDASMLVVTKALNVAERLGIAKNPLTSPETLTKLAMNDVETIARQAVMNASCPPDTVLSYVASFGVKALLRPSAAAHTKVAAVAGRLFQAHPDPAVITAVATHNDADGTVRRVALAVPQISDDLVCILMARKGHGSTSRAAIRNPYIDVSLLPRSAMLDEHRSRIVELLDGDAAHIAASDPARQVALVAASSATLDRLVVTADVIHPDAIMAICNRASPCPDADVVAAAIEACSTSALDLAAKGPSYSRRRVGEAWSKRLVAVNESAGFRFGTADVVAAAAILADDVVAWQIAATLFEDTSDRPLAERAAAARDISVR